ncbi:MAG: amino acid adenylation domain-containing protein, partial [Pseudomonadota bacterium]
MNRTRFPSVIVPGAVPAITDSRAETIQDLFTEQALRTPAALAIVYRDGALSYGQFNACADRLANRLLKMGLVPGQAVAFLCDRTPLMLVALMGILKARGYFVPIDPTYPAARMNHIVKDCAPFALVSDRDAAGLAELGVVPAGLFITLTDADMRVAEGEVIPAPGLTGSGEDLVYSIYTSGSTGMPKGTLNFQKGVVNLNRWMVDDFKFGTHTRFMVMTSIGFDLTGKNVCAPLVSGGALVLYDSTIYDPARIRQMIAEFGVNTFTHTPTGLYGLVEDAIETNYRLLAGVEEVVISGEALHLGRIKAWLTHPLCKARLVNGYGPTECSDQVAFHVVKAEDLERGGVCPLGIPTTNVVLTVRDANLQIVPFGEKGEMCVQGIGVGGGYQNLPEKTAKAFVTDPLDGSRLYRMGDLVSQRADGVYLYHGRFDFQVKIRGYRVELSEIEGALNACNSVRESIVMAPEGANGERSINAYLRMEPGAAREVSHLNAQLAEVLPDYMMPASYTFMEQFPVNASNKVDRGALPAPSQSRPNLATAFRAPQGVVETRLADLWSTLLGFGGIGSDDRFFELGGNSLMAVRMVGQLNKLLGITVPIVQFFEAPTLAGFASTLIEKHPQALARWLGPDAPASLAAAAPTPAPAMPSYNARQPSGGPVKIAIVGMAAQVPGALSVEAFWQNLLDSVNSIERLSAEQLAAAGVPAERASEANYVPVSGWVANSDCFDHSFFGYTPREAERIDPQQRLLLETAFAAFEQGGMATDRINKRVGVYASVAANSYFPRNVLAHDGAAEYGLGYSLLGNDKDYAAARIAYKLGLTGPAIAVQTACSSSGTAIHLACQALIAGDCDAALAGGASLPWQYQFGHEHVPDGALSATGRVHAFDAKASGMVLTGGAVCVVLKRLDDALADGDTVQAVLLATALNNDGEDKLSFTAPSVLGQQAVIRAALARAGVNARSISVMEAHGTGTPLGDPIEVAALTQAWREDTADVGYCALGSVKTNVGHLDAAAAAASLVKIALMMQHRERPASLNYESPNPECQFETSPFVVNASRMPWASDSVRRAALSSFGFGGTNFHAIVEEAPAHNASAPKRDWQVLRLSAKSEAGLKQQIAALSQTLETSPRTLADIAHTLDTGRNRYSHRAAVVARTADEARARLASAEQLLTSSHPLAKPSLVFTFPGQGAQHVGMGRRLYETEAVFRSAVNQCADILLPALGVDLRDVLYPKGDATQAAETLRATQLAQPAIFTISYATAKLWMSWGLQPQTMIGHSVGEFVAATLAGVFELEHALLILAERARLMQSMPSGGMLAVRLSDDEAQQYVTEEIAIAGINAPQLTVLSGPHAALDALKATLDAAGVGTTVLHTSHAFHSSMMQPIVAGFARVVGQYPRSAPRLSFYSSLTGAPITDAQAQDPHYWAQQLRNAVRFAPALLHAAQSPGRVLLECGPGQNLTTGARQTLKPVHGAVAIASLPHAGAAEADDAEHVMSAIARLFLAGVEIDARRFHAGETRLKVSLPTYPFARVRHWLSPVARTAVTAQPALAAVAVAQAPTAAVEAAPVLASAETRVMDAIRTLFADVAGVAIGPAEDNTSFLELGFDSLLLTQVTAQINRKLKVTMRFRQLLEEFTTPAKLVAQLVTLGAGEPVAPEAKPAVAPPDAPAQMDGTPQKVFGAGTRINKTTGEELTAQQEKALSAFIARYTARTAKSKAYADEHRPYLADPRAVSGFRPLWKDLVYPIVSATSKGPRLTDIDGNDYVDITNGFGCIFFGHRPDFMVKAIHEQIDTDIIIGPQNPVAGECAKLFAEMTGHERVAFCNTGSEAVLAAIRVARTVTGRNLIVQHTGDYHGIFDEVLVRGTPSGRTVPAAPGIPPESVVNTLILDYGDPKSLEVLRARADEIAAVVIEPVQSRKPDLQPADYVREVRKICDASGTALIMDEVVCGFRVHQAGAQGVWGVKADIGCYGKVFGAGMPVGALAGTARFMDALDGGSWRFGDDSMPEVGVTYFAGTFVRHPLTMAVVLATLKHMKENPGLQAQVNETARSLVDPLNALFKAEGLPMHIGRFGSLMKPEWKQELRFGELLYFFLREAGVNAW